MKWIPDHACICDACPVRDDRINPLEVVMALQYGWLPVGNEEVRYFEGGEGPPLVFLHGAFSSMEVWKPAAEILSRHFHVFAFDLPGFGSSKKNNVSCSIAFFADFLRDLMEKRNFSRPTVIGSSLGSRIALEFVLKYPTEADKLILQGPAGIFGAPWSFKSIITILFAHPLFLQFYLSSGNVKRIWKNGISHDNAHFKNVWESNPSFHDDDEHKLWIRAFSRSVRSLVRRPTQRQLSNLCRPVMIVSGGKDKHHPSREAKKISQLITGSRLEILPDAGHFLMLERPEEFAKIVADFAGQLPGRKSA